MKKLLTFENFLILISAFILTIILFLPTKGLTGCPYGKTTDLIPGGSCPYFVPGQNNLCDLAGPQATKTVTTFNFSSWQPFSVFLILISLSILILFSKSIKLKTEGRFLLIGASLVFFYFYWSKLCPISTFQAIFLQKELVVAKIFVFLFFLTPLFLALLFGRLFCGFICPIGAIQEIFFRLPRCQRPNLKFFRLPKILALLPFLILGVLSILVYKLKSPIFCKLDPFSFLFCKKYTFLFFILSSLFLVLSIFIFRPFCLLFCPYGAILKILFKFSLFGLKIEKGKCGRCGLCEKICPAGAIEKESASWRIKTEDCFLCADCQKNCRQESIKFTLLEK